MKIAHWSVCALALVATLSASPGALHAVTAPGVVHGRLHVSDASIAVRCPLTIGGGFEAKTSALSGELVVDPERQGEVEGTLAVDLRSLQTGIGMRDTHMRERYLEVNKGEGFTTATLNRIRLDGMNSAAPMGKVTFRGVLALHGQEREVTGTADIKVSGQNLRVQASFPVQVSDFAIPSPTYLGVGVRNEVTVAVNFQAASKRPL
jgi:polyisoprenoid-binding protein YceI